MHLRIIGSEQALLGVIMILINFQLP